MKYQSTDTSDVLPAVVRKGVAANALLYYSRGDVFVFLQSIVSRGWAGGRTADFHPPPPHPTPTPPHGKRLITISDSPLVTKW